ncbi:hypothetical protein [Evansella tamaricis]|uniref:Uncharacterized protein n=1 Tax=Evansella tamaricis TaxID=2069301 RepID=A0ABS6JJP5_9BACI|nr:hypothetical protein [Evansella tamaricis]MBU9712538.1 hypothetical protein [Evansella tamaricis]
MPDGRTGRPNIGHATGRGALPDERIRILEKLEEEEAVTVTVTFARDRGANAYIIGPKKKTLIKSKKID